MPAMCPLLPPATEQRTSGDASNVPNTRRSRLYAKDRRANRTLEPRQTAWHCAPQRPGRSSMTVLCRVLMIYPKFVPNSFWNYAEACELVGAKYPAAPLILITVAAMLPKHWDIRLVNRNTEPLTDADLDWADLVMIGGMLNQQPDFIYLIDLAHLHGKPVCVGGPDVSSSPHLYADADFQVIGEAEHIMADFIAAWESGERKGVFIAEKFKIDVTQSPMPRYDLIKFDHYLFVGVQYSRGCPFTCEFCDIIELYGRVPRTKTNDQILAELQALYDHGYRGHVDFVDDNFIGNKKNLRTLMPRLKAWLEERDYPFEFSTEASINIADDEELLQAMKDANFFAIFVGIESPDPETLVQMKKKQNTRRNIAECIHKIYGYGIFITAGFIVGFDTEKVSMGQAMIDFIEETNIPVCMVGLLYALPGTQLTRRLAEEGRLHKGHDLIKVEQAGDPCRTAVKARCQSRSLRPPPRAAGWRHAQEAWRHRQRAQDHAGLAGGSRAVLEDLRRGRQDQSRRAALNRDADGAVHAPRAVLEARDQ